MKADRPEYNSAYVRRANMSKLLSASKMAMTHRVMLAIDAGYLKTLSLNDWQGNGRRAAFVEKFALLGVFGALPEETRADVYRRLYDEAKSAGAQLGEPESVE